MLTSQSISEKVVICGSVFLYTILGRCWGYVEGASCLGTRGGITRLPKQGNGSKWKLEEEKSLTFKVYGKRCSKRSYLVYVVE